MIYGSFCQIYVKYHLLINLCTLDLFCYLKYFQKEVDTFKTRHSIQYTYSRWRWWLRGALKWLWFIWELLVPLSKALHYASGDLSNFVFHACDEFIIYLSVQLVHPFYSCPRKIIRIIAQITSNFWIHNIYLYLIRIVI